jgi:hypothetical protein
MNFRDEISGKQIELKEPFVVVTGPANPSPPRVD